MIEDKQIYSSSKKAEFERKFKSFVKDLKNRLDQFRKERRQKTALKEVALKPKEEIANPATIVVHGEALKENEVEFNTSNKKIIKHKEEKKVPLEKLQLIVTLTLFLLILFIIALGIYLPYKNR